MGLADGQQAHRLTPTPGTPISVDTWFQDKVKPPSRELARVGMR